MDDLKHWALIESNFSPHLSRFNFSQPAKAVEI